MEKYHRSPVKDYISVSNYAGEHDFPVEQPDEVQIEKDVYIYRTPVPRCLRRMKYAIFSARWAR